MADADTCDRGGTEPGEERRVEELDVLVIGAGPSGLTAADRLATAGCPPLVVERTGQVGGLMRSIRRGSFTVDLGRKELYSRIAEIDVLWGNLLGDDYRAYPHRVGSLFGGAIIELSGGYRGPTRGMSAGLLIPGGIDLVRGWAGGMLHKPANYEGFWYQRAGRRFARALAQGYWEKFRGQRWRDLPAPDELADGQTAGSHAFAAIRQGLGMARRGGPGQQRAWRHPRLGTGQLTRVLAERFRAAEGDIAFETEVTGLSVRDDGRMAAVLTDRQRTRRVIARHVISSLPVEALMALLEPDRADRHVPPPAQTRAVMLVYLFLNQPPRFPHAWLEVNDPALRCGRITNFAAFGGDMVPPGMTALCVETFLDGDDPRLDRPEAAWIDSAIAECTRNRLIDPQRIVDAMVVRIDRCNAAASWRDAQSAARAALLARLPAYPAVYHVHRPGTDWASFAGLLAAEAVLAGDRRAFDHRADPTRSFAAANTVATDEEKRAPCPADQPSS